MLSLWSEDFYVQYKETGDILIDDKPRNLVNARTALLDRSLWAEKADQSNTMSLSSMEKNRHFTSISKIKRRQNGSSSINLSVIIPRKHGSLNCKLTVFRYPVEKDGLSNLTSSFKINVEWENQPAQSLTLFQTDSGWWSGSDYTRGKVNHRKSFRCFI